ncbi:hypothetical protein V6N13_053195 [Hibiscus sabdariffa]|uniref:Uncharacterized protein n=1 Tax=Hibiscus sabdariffa TaxID=183260 RepID=A0ABR2Q6J3_9ROSI
MDWYSVATGPIAMHHPSLQPYPFFGNHNPGAIANPCSTFMPYSTTSSSPVEQPSSQHKSSHTSSKRDSKSKLVDNQRGSNRDICDSFNNVATELELKITGSSTNKAAQYQRDFSPNVEGKVSNTAPSQRQLNG